jgi:hypothetical protein
MTGIEKEIASLTKMPRTQLVGRWRELCGANPPPQISRDLLTRTIAYRIQAREYGGLDKNTERRLRSFAHSLETEGDVPLNPDLTLKPGAKLIREWHGQTYTVIVLDEGFECNGRKFRSLSQIACEITGSHWSGRRFFGLTSEMKVAPQSCGDES